MGLIADHGFGGSGSLGRSMLAATALFAILGLPFALLLYRSFDRAAAAHENAGHR